MAVLAALGACDFNPARKCGSDAECGPGGRCDLAQSTCVAGSGAAPEFTLIAPSAPARPALDGGLVNAWRRDETVLIQVTSASHDVQKSSVTWTVAGVFADGGAAPTAQLNSVASQTCGAGVDAGYCGSFVVSAWEPRLDTLSGKVTVTVVGQDSRHQLGTGQVQLDVTRFKWAVGLGSSIKATPAVGDGGLVYVATDDGSSGRVFALRPGDGGSAWAAPFALGPVVASPAVANSGTVFAAEAKTSSFIYALNGADGTQTFKCGISDLTAIDGPFRASLAIVQAPAEAAIGVANGSNNLGSIVTIRPLATSNTCIETVTGIPASYPSAVTSDTSRCYFGSGGGSVEAYHYLSSPAGWTHDWGTGSTGAIANSVQIVDGGLIGTGNPRGAFRLNQATGAFEGNFPDGGVSTTPGSAVIAADGKAIFGNGSTLLAGVPASGTTTASASTTGEVTAAPALGQGSTLYTLSKTGHLEVWDSTLQSLWRTQLTTSAFTASPNLDCTRDSNGTAMSRPGVLYAAGEDGRLYAIVVDSHGLDTASPWPKYQHDSRNTGNSTTPIEACP